ncbi:Smt3-specific protease [Lobulomyces angularis]|nr:Smt3-specific protease [Lobulomyces angularis]
MSIRKDISLKEGKDDFKVHNIKPNSIFSFNFLNIKNIFGSLLGDCDNELKCNNFDKKIDVANLSKSLTPEPSTPSTQSETSSYSSIASTPIARKPVYKKKNYFKSRRSTQSPLILSYRNQKKKQSILNLVDLQLYNLVESNGFEGSQQEYIGFIEYLNKTTKENEANNGFIFWLFSFNLSIAMLDTKYPVIVSEEIKNKKSNKKNNKNDWLEFLKRVNRGDQEVSEIETPIFDDIVKEQNLKQQEIDDSLAINQYNNFPQLTEDQKLEVKRILAPGEGTVVNAFNVPLQKHDIRTLLNSTWLNDEIMRDYLAQEHMDKKKVPFDFCGWVDIDSRDCPVQHNGYDCGVFTCIFAEYLSRNEDFDFSQKDMQYYRERLVWEICNLKLLIE